MQDFMVWALVLIVAVATTAVVYFNRKQVRSKMSGSKREPLFHQPYYDKLEQEQSRELSGEFYDPIVAGHSKHGSKASAPVNVKFNKDLLTKHKMSKQEVTKSDKIQWQPRQTYVIKPVTNEISETADSNEAENQKVKAPNRTALPAGNPVRAAEFFPNGIISLMLMAKPDKPYAGYELLQALLSSGLRYGKMNIFHRYEQTQLTAHTADMKILFSLASVVKPGTFEMTKMGAFSTPGLVLFMQVADQVDASTSFEIMLETAKQLTDDLEGDIWDAHKKILNEESIAQIRHSLNQYEQALSTEDLFS